MPVKAVHVVEAGHDDNSPPLFLCSVEAGKDPWFTELFIRHHKATFKLDTGTDVTAIPEYMYKDIAESHYTLVKSDGSLSGPEGSPGNMLSLYKETLHKREYTVQETDICS